jgi:epoxyqueuosine reductase
MKSANKNTPYSDIRALVGEYHLNVFGAFYPEPEDAAPSGCKTMLLLGPKEPGFWGFVTAEPEFQDKFPDPVDRWSKRVITNLADTLDGIAVFPFGGPPYAPFISWAQRTGRAWTSPVSLLVHDTAGLFLSYRGAIALKDRIALPNSPPDRPCLSACPAEALNGNGYDLNACHAFLNTISGQDCMTGGCAVRRSCPVSQSHGRRAVQSAHHMKAFHS